MVYSVTDDDDSRLISPNTPQLVKYVPCADSVNIPKMSEPASKMLQDLLNALAVKYTQTKDEGKFLYCVLMFVSLTVQYVLLYASI